MKTKYLAFFQPAYFIMATSVKRWNNGDICREELQREKMNIIKTHNGWTDAEIFMIWDFEEWIEGGLC